MDRHDDSTDSGRPGAAVWQTARQRLNGEGLIVAGMVAGFMTGPMFMMQAWVPAVVTTVLALVLIAVGYRL